jgi:Family of unknown function (DUF6069)
VPESRHVVNAGMLWAGGLTAGVVGGGVVLVAFLFVHGVLDIPLLVERGGELVTASTWWYALGAFLCGAAATGLLHALLLTVPNPFGFFRWIVGLAVTLAVLVPWTLDTGRPSQLAMSVINLVVGVCLGSIVDGVGRSSARVRDAPLPGHPSHW